MNHPVSSTFARHAERRLGLLPVVWVPWALGRIVAPLVIPFVANKVSKGFRQQSVPRSPALMRW